MLVSEVHSQNAYSPIEVTLFGIVMLVSEVQFTNAPKGISAPEVMVTFSRLLFEIFEIAHVGSVASFIFVQPQNAPSPIEVTLLGIVMLVSEVQ